MSIEVRVPEEIKEYKESIIAGLSVRQLICGGAALLCGIPTFLLLKNINMDLATYATMAVTIPAFCVGFIKKGGYNFETYLKIRLYTFFVKSKRGYETHIDRNSLPIEVEQYRQAAQAIMAEEKENENKKGGRERAVHKEKQVSGGYAKTTKTEHDFIEVTEKSIKRKRKAAYKSIKAAAGSNRKKKSGQEEKA